MVTNRFATEIVKETVSVIGTVGAAVADEMMTIAPEKDTMRATPTTIQGASEDTDTSHPLLFTEAQWFVGWVSYCQISCNFIPFSPRVRYCSKMSLARLNSRTSPATAFATPPPPPPLGMLWSTDSLLNQTRVSRACSPNPPLLPLYSSLLGSIANTRTGYPHGN